MSLDSKRRFYSGTKALAETKDVNQARTRKRERAYL